jgi:tellurite methyltransferase
MSPSPFMVEWIARLADGAAHTKRGRYALPLARAGFRTFGVDVALEPVREAIAAAASEALRVRAWCADLTQHPLPERFFDLVVVSRYLQRDLLGALREACVPGGVVLYETFTTAQRALGTGPRSPDHLLEPGELRARFAEFEELFYEETTAPEAVARIAARRPE